MIENVEEFIRLTSSEDAAERHRAAWEEAPTEVWITLIEQHSDMSFAVAHNRTIPVEVMRLLMGDSDWRVRSRVASKNSCPSEILELLASDEHEAVVSTVAGHPNTPASALLKLAKHPWIEVSNKAIRQLTDRGE